MISFAALWGVTLRHIRMWRRDPNILLGGFYWPFLDILIWGFLGSWIAKAQATEFHNFEVTALLGILLWQVVGRGSSIMGMAFSEELWSNNVVNLFSLPLRIIEWMGGIILFYVIMLSFTTIACMIGMFMLYDVPAWTLFSAYFYFLPPLFFSALWLGFICLSIMVTLGKHGVELGFVFVWFLLPFSGAYYPIEVLPKWGQILSSYLPMSYVFQGMRNYLMHNQDPSSYLLKGYILSILYAIGTMMLFVYCFNLSKKKGLARLAD